MLLYYIENKFRKFNLKLNKFKYKTRFVYNLNNSNHHSTPISSIIFSGRTTNKKKELILKLEKRIRKKR